MPGIVTLDHPCWILTYPREREFELHHDTEAQALKDAAEDDDDNRGIPKRLDHVCSVATTVCGYQYDEDGDYGTQHWPDPGDLKTHLVALNYRFTGDGSLLCPAENDCDECDALQSAVVPPEIPGQMTIGEVSC